MQYWAVSGCFFVHSFEQKQSGPLQSTCPNTKMRTTCSQVPHGMSQNKRIKKKLSQHIKAGRKAPWVAFHSHQLQKKTKGGQHSNLPLARIWGRKEEENGEEGQQRDQKSSQESACSNTHTHTYIYIYIHGYIRMETHSCTQMDTKSQE